VSLKLCPRTQRQPETCQAQHYLPARLPARPRPEHCPTPRLGTIPSSRGPAAHAHQTTWQIGATRKKSVRKPPTNLPCCCDLPRYRDRFADGDRPPVRSRISSDSLAGRPAKIHASARRASHRHSSESKTTRTDSACHATRCKAAGSPGLACMPRWFVMTEQGNCKRAVRQAARRTGQRYTRAGAGS
jgi:hypothetical protein